MDSDLRRSGQGGLHERRCGTEADDGTFIMNETLPGRQVHLGRGERWRIATRRVVFFGRSAARAHSGLANARVVQARAPCSRFGTEDVIITFFVVNTQLPLSYSNPSSWVTLSQGPLCREAATHRCLVSEDATHLEHG